MATPEDIINSELESPSVFKNKGILSPDYIPKRLLHREDKIRELTIAFKDIINDPGNSSIRVVIWGRTGTGKTATTKSFGYGFKGITNNRGIKSEYIHINCHRQRTLYLLTLEIANILKLPIPVRGLSSQEVFKVIHDYLDKRNMYIIVTLDEFDYLVNTSPQEDVYFLVRLYDEISAAVKRISYIFIVRDLSTINSLDKSIKDHILRNIIEFKPYSSIELYDILQDRVREAFNENAVLDDAVKFVADMNGFDKGGSGNARLSIETLQLAGEIADREKSLLVTLDHVKLANSKLNQEASIIFDEIGDLELHSLLLIKSVSNLSKRFRDEAFSMGKVEEEYQQICKDIGEEPRRHTQVYEYVRRLKLMGIFNTQQSGRGTRGRTTLISLSVPLSQEFDDYITKQIRGKLNTKYT